MHKAGIVVLLLLGVGCSAGPETVATQEGPIVVMETTMGLIKVKLHPTTCPVTVKNFLRYVNEGFFDGTIFHRVVPGFVVQGGGLTPDLLEKPTHDPIPNEARGAASNLRGTIAMARTEVRDSATAQFYFNLVDNKRLDYSGESERGWGYAVFGQVVEGMGVIDAIATVPTGAKGEFDGQVPMHTVTILRVYAE